MGIFGQLIYSLLITPPGNFIYHLVMIFSSTAAIQAVLANRGGNATPQSRRMLTGLACLLAGQIILFLCSGLSWKNMLDLRSFQPPLDRTIILLSLLWIGWLWCYPYTSAATNIITAILSLVIVVCFAITGFLWARIFQATAFNGSWLDLSWNVLALLVLGAGILMLLVLRPKGFGTGLAILGINLLGFIIHFISSPMIGDYAPVVRYAGTVTFPLLPLLSLHIQKPATVIQPLPVKRKITTARSGSAIESQGIPAGQHPQEIRPVLAGAAAEMPVTVSFPAHPYMGSKRKAGNVTMSSIPAGQIGAPPVSVADIEESSSEITWPSGLKDMITFPMEEKVNDGEFISHRPLDLAEQVAAENRELIGLISKVQGEGRELISRIDRLYSNRTEAGHVVTGLGDTVGLMKEIGLNAVDNIEIAGTMVETLCGENAPLDVSDEMWIEDNADLKDLLCSLAQQNQALSQLVEMSPLPLNGHHQVSNTEIHDDYTDLDAQEDEDAPADTEVTKPIVIKPRSHAKPSGEITQPVRISPPAVAQDHGSPGSSEEPKVHEPAALYNERILDLGKEIGNIQLEIKKTIFAVRSRHEEVEKVNTDESTVALSDVAVSPLEEEKKSGDDGLNDSPSAVPAKPWMEDVLHRATMEEVIDANQNAQGELQNKLEEMNQLIESMRIEKEKLQLELRKANDSLDHTLQNQQKIDAELRMTLEEIARLETLIDRKETDQAGGKD